VIACVFEYPMVANNVNVPSPGWYDNAQPAIGMIFDWIDGAANKSAFNTILNPLFEGVSSHGAHCKNTTGNVFFGGSMEGVGGYGIVFDEFNAGTSAGSNENKVLGTDFEENTTGDVTLGGARNELLDVYTQDLITIPATAIDATVHGGTHSQITIASGAARSRVQFPKYNQYNDGSTITDAGTDTLVRDPTDLGAGTIGLAGSASKPVFGFGNSGLYFSAESGDVVVTLNGTEKARFTASSGAFVLANGLTVGAANVVNWPVGTYIYGGNNDGIVRLGSLNGVSVSLTFGGETSAVPRLSVAGTSLVFRRGDGTVGTFSDLPAAASANEGAVVAISDGSTATWGATVTGGGSNHVMVRSNGTNWTVFAA
jgi:hypothetical protein